MGGGGVGAAVCVRVRLPAPKGAHCSVAADGAAGVVRLPTPRWVYHSVAADGAAGVGEAADPAEGAPLCGGGWGCRCG